MEERFDEKWDNIMNFYDPIEIDEPIPNCEHFQSGSSILNSGKLGVGQVKFEIREIPPGKIGTPYHFHHLNEEVFIILEGEATLRQNDKRRIVKKGDIIFFPTGPEGAHQLYNHSNKPVRYFDMVAQVQTDFVEYPDTHKVNCEEIGIFEKKNQVGYWKGEEKPSRFWVELK